ncbi:MAG: hypothetical protein GY820_48115 [Gammaproteobacteria bacterium]|nr:hypothetical protein [Gammaproteobacteria bacterium]
MKTCEYLEKMRSQFDDAKLYQKQRKNCNPVTGVHDRLSRKLKTLNCHTNLLISKEAATVSIPYGLPKIHKEGTPLRIIVPMIGGVSYKLSKYLDQLLRPIVNILPHRIVSADSLLSELRQFKNTNNLFLGSLDVVALFPSVNIPFFLRNLPAVLENHQKLWKTIENPLAHISATQLADLIAEICSNTYFKFEDTAYKQLNGVPMGSPVSVAIAEIFMHILESDAIKNCSSPPLFYKRYIDDCLVITRNHKEFEQFYNHMNSHALASNGIQFTREHEQNGTLPFLDVNISRGKNQLEFSVYRKKTHSNRYCHPTSAVPKSVCAGIVKSMRLRAQRYCSEENATKTEIRHLKSAFQKKWI